MVHNGRALPSRQTGRHTASMQSSACCCNPPFSHISDAEEKLSVEERVVPRCIVVDIRVVIIRRVVKEVVTAVSASETGPAAAVKAAAVALGGGGGRVVSVDHSGAAAVELLPLLPTTVAVVVAAAATSMMMIMLVLMPTAAATTLALVAAGYDVSHAEAAPREPGDFFIVCQVCGVVDLVTATGVFPVQGVTLAFLFLFLGFLS